MIPTNATIEAVRVRKVTSDLPHPILHEAYGPFPDNKFTWNDPPAGETLVYFEAMIESGAIIRSKPRVVSTKLFEYKAGMDIGELDGTFSRGSTGTGWDFKNGTLIEADNDTLRDNHWVENPVTGLWERALLLEGQRTNLVSHSTSFDSGWTSAGHSYTGTDIINPVSGLPSPIWNVATNGYRFQDISNIGSPPSSIRVAIWTNLEHDLAIRWRDGGSGAPNLVQRVYPGWNHVMFSDLNYDSGVRFLIEYRSTNRNSGDIDPIPSGLQIAYGHVQVEDAPFPSSYISTSGSAVTRAADDLTFDFPHAPQPMTIYCRFIEGGTSIQQSGTVWIAVIGNTSLSNGMLGLFRSGSFNNGYGLYIRGEGSQAQRNSGVIPDIGDVVELCGRAVVTPTSYASELDVAVNNILVSSGGTSPQGSLFTNWNTALDGQMVVGGVASNRVFSNMSALRIDRGIHSLETMRKAALNPTIPRSFEPALDHTQELDGKTYFFVDWPLS